MGWIRDDIPERSESDCKLTGEGWGGGENTSTPALSKDERCVRVQINILAIPGLPRQETGEWGGGWRGGGRGEGDFREVGMS